MGSTARASRDEFAAYYRVGPGERAPREERAPARRDRGATSRREPTKQELYDKAKRLGIAGRSKMSKQELARALERHGGPASTAQTTAKANPIEVQKFLEGVGYPTETTQLVQEAARQGASGEVRQTLERLPKKQFATPTEVSEAIGKLD